MENSKIVSLLRSMPEAEIKALRRWVKIHGAKKDAYRLFEYIFKNLLPENQEQLSKQVVFKSLYRNKTYNDLKLRYMNFELLRMCEDFIVFESISQNPHQYQLSLLQYFRKRSLSKFFDQTYSSLKDVLNAQPLRDSDYFFTSMSVNSEYNKFLKSKQNRAIEPNIQRLSDDLDIFYLLNKLKVYSEALNYKNILQVDYNIRFVDELLKEIQQIGMDDYPAVKIYYYALLTLLENENEDHFHELKKNILQYKKIFSIEELQGTYTLARNYCIKKINLGNKEFVRELFELYQWELELINESEDKELPPAIYKNIITLAFMLNELEWTFHFIEKYTPYLPEEHRESHYNFNMATYHFKKKEYDRVIKLLSHVEYNDFFMQLSAKSLLMKTYFELKEYLPFDSLVHSFKILVQSKKVLGYHRNNYINFIKYCRKLLFYEKLSSSELSKLGQEISETKELVEKDWLQEKLHGRSSSRS
jgi:hypothetical protein